MTFGTFIPKKAAHILGAALLGMSMANVAQAAPIAIFDMSTTTPQVGVPIVFDGSRSVCDVPTGCSYTWQWYYRTAGGALLRGGQMGRTPSVTYTFDGFAASKPYVIVALTVGAGRLVRSSTSSVSFVADVPLAFL